MPDKLILGIPHTKFMVIRYKYLKAYKIFIVIILTVGVEMEKSKCIDKEDLSNLLRRIPMSDTDMGILQKTIDNTINETYKKGYCKGYDDGYTDGYKKGEEEGYDNGWDDAY